MARIRKKNYNQVGTIWKGELDKNGHQLPHNIKFDEGFIPRSDMYYQFHSKKFKELDLDRKIAYGWTKPEHIEAAKYTISKMSDKVIAEIIEVKKIPKKDETKE